MENMRKVVICMDAGLAGTEGMTAWLVPKDISDDDLSGFAWRCGVDHAEMYGIYPRGEYAENPDITDEELDGDEYSDNIEGWWEEYDSEKHDGHLIFGHNSDFQWNQY